MHQQKKENIENRNKPKEWCLNKEGCTEIPSAKSQQSEEIEEHRVREPGKEPAAKKRKLFIVQKRDLIC